MKSWTGFVVGMTLASALPLATQAQTSNYLALGTWKMDPAKSKFDPGPAPASVTRVYEATPDGIKVTIQTTNASGETQTRGSTSQEDGKTYPVHGTPNYDAIATTRINALQSRTALMRGGKVVGQLITAESKDHKVLTTTYTFTTSSGTKEHDVVVLDRQ